MSDQQRYPVRDVFTPTTPARLTFVERQSINDKLVNAIRTPGKQVVVYGHSGSGKTTLLANKLDQLYERHVSSRCMRGLTFDHLLLDAFDQLSPYYEVEKTTTSSGLISAQVGADYWGIKSQLSSGSQSSKSVRHQRILPPQLTPQALARFLGEARCCWVLEDFHKVEDDQKTKLSQMMKVFMDMADNYKEVKIIAIGAVDTARQVVQYDSEMRNRVAEIHVPLMIDDELQQIITKGETLLNVTFPDKIKTGIVHYSNGLASVCHHICLNTCVAAGIETTTLTLTNLDETNMKAGLTQYLEEASDTLKHAFDRALKRKKSGKFDNCRIILNALAELPQEGATHAEIFEKIGIRNYPSGNLTYYLRELATEGRGGIIRGSSASGKFAFTDPIYRAFCLAYFEKNPLTKSRLKTSEIGIHEILADLDVSEFFSSSWTSFSKDLFGATPPSTAPTVANPVVTPLIGTPLRHPKLKTDSSDQPV